MLMLRLAARPLVVRGSHLDLLGGQHVPVLLQGAGSHLLQVNQHLRPRSHQGNVSGVECAHAGGWDGSGVVHATVPVIPCRWEAGAQACGRQDALLACHRPWLA